MADYGELGTFSTEYPWPDVSPLDLGYSVNVLSMQYSDSTFGILGSRPAVIPDHPDSIQTYFSLGFSLISVNEFSGRGIFSGSPKNFGTLSVLKSVLKKLNCEILNKPSDFKYGKS